MQLMNPNAGFFLDLPTDLRVWLDERTLVTATFEAIHSLYGTGASRLGNSAFLPPGKPRTLGTMLTYCYAVGLYSSDEIEFLVNLDPTIRYLAAGVWPVSSEIRGFRRQFRLSIEEALALVLQSAWESHLRSLMTNSPESGALGFRVLGGRDSDDLQTHFNRAAKDRVQYAVKLDSTLLDV